MNGCSLDGSLLLQHHLSVCPDASTLSSPAELCKDDEEEADDARAKAEEEEEEECEQTDDEKEEQRRRRRKRRRRRSRRSKRKRFIRNRESVQSCGLATKGRELLCLRLLILRLWRGLLWLQLLLISLGEGRGVHSSRNSEGMGRIGLLLLHLFDGLVLPAAGDARGGVDHGNARNHRGQRFGM